MGTKIRAPHIASALLAAAAVVVTASCLVEEIPAEDVVDTGVYEPIEELRSTMPTSERVEHIDDGAFCLFSNEAPEMPTGIAEEQVFEVGDRIVFRVATQECLSGSCDTERVANCDVAMRGTNIEVTSELAYTHQQYGMCTLDCGMLEATCESEPLGEGTYTVTLGHRFKKLTVPGTTTSCVAEDQCETDADCDGFCGWGANGERICKLYATQGEACNGYMPPEYVQQCEPGLACVTNGDLPDMPGICWPTCTDDDDCASGLCREVGDYNTSICVLTDS